MLTNLLYVFLGGGIGSAARFGISMLMITYYRGSFPVATLLSNILSCLVLGLTLYLTGEKFNTELPLRLLLITGFCGGFSTFSAFSYETMEMLRSGSALYALINVLVTVSVCFGIIYLFVRST